jgi:hypothetical protein
MPCRVTRLANPMRDARATWIDTFVQWLLYHARPTCHRVPKVATSDQDLFDQMTALYPDWVANQSSLMFGFPRG